MNLSRSRSSLVALLSLTSACSGRGADDGRVASAGPKVELPNTGAAMQLHLGKGGGSSAAASGRSGVRPVGGRHGATSGGFRTRRKPPTYTPGTGLVIPHWTPTFTASGGQEYSVAVLGADPSLGVTTTIPTVIIPYRLVFADGSVIDASEDVIDGVTPVEGIVNSPIFQSVPWTAGGEPLGDTQWGDAILRANYWQQQPGAKNAASTSHVIFGAPTILPAVTLNVPAGVGYSVFNPTTGRVEGEIDAQWLFDTNVTQTVAAGVTPAQLPIHVMGEVVGVFLDGSGFLGYHFDQDLSSLTGVVGDQLRVVTSYWGAQSTDGASRPDIANTGVVAHEVAETLNDPSLDNDLGPWEIIGQPGICYSPILEVGDPLEYINPGFEQMLGGKAYRFPDVAFTPWFMRMNHSFSVGGQYDLLNDVHAPATSCTDPGYYSFYFLGQGAGYTYDEIPTSVNNTKQAVGYLASGGEAVFAFTYSTFDPGAGNVTGFSIVSVPVPGVPGQDWYSAANGINDAGVIVGSFTDTLGTHGFLLSAGQYTTLDFPGAAATVAQGINSRVVPDVVGYYLDAAGASHGFVLRKGKYTAIDAAGGTNTVVNGINDHQEIVGTFDLGGVSQGFEGHFVRDDDTCPATLGTLDYPRYPGDGATAVATFLSAINNSDQAVGWSTAYAPDGTSSTIAFFEAAGQFLGVNGGSQEFDGAYTTMMMGLNDANISVGLATDPLGTLGEIWVPYTAFTGPSAFAGGETGVTSPAPTLVLPTLPIARR